MGWQVETEEWSWGEKKPGAPPPSLEISGMTPVVFYHPISRGTVSFVGLGEVCGQGKRGELEAGGGNGPASPAANADTPRLVPTPSSGGRTVLTLLYLGRYLSTAFFFIRQSSWNIMVKASCEQEARGLASPRQKRGLGARSLSRVRPPPFNVPFEAFA